MVGEKATTDITISKDSEGFEECKESAAEGGTIAKNTRKELANSAKSFSKDGRNKIEREEKSSAVRITRMVLFFIGGIIGLMILIVVVMWIFKICPPQGPWMMPPWC